MFNEQQDLSYDLEWMLQSGQVSLPILAEAFLAEYGSALFRLCLSIVDDEQATRRLVCATISSALLHAYRFRPESPAQIKLHTESDQKSALLIKSWLFHLALDHIRSLNIFKNLPNPPDHWLDFNRRAHISSISLAERANSVGYSVRPRIRLVACLYYLHRCSPIEIAEYLRISESSVHADLERFRFKLFQGENHAAKEINISQVDDALFEIGQQASANMFLSEVELRELSETSILLAEKKARNKKFGYAIIQAAVIILSSLSIGGMVWWINLVSPAPEPTIKVVYQTVLVTRDGSASMTDGEMAATPVPGIIPVPTLNPNEVIYIVQPGDTLSSIADQYSNVSPGLLLEINRLAPGAILEPGLSLLLPVSLPEAPWPAATPVDQESAAVEETPEGPRRSAGMPEIYSQFRWFTSGWQTLWVDVLFTDFETPNELNRGTNIRLQAWLSGSQLLALTGLPGKPPQEVLLALFDENLFFRAQPEKGLGWFEEIGSQEAYSSKLIDVYLTRLLNPFYPGVRPGNRYFVMTGTGVFDGHETEMVEEFQKSGVLTGRMKIDQQGGLILHRQKYNPEIPESLLFEMNVIGWQYNVDFPQALFDPRLPWRGGFAQDSEGRPEVLSTPQP